MQYLNLETCQILDKLGCKADSHATYVMSKGNWWFRYDNEPIPKTPIEKGVDAFTFDDICTKENAIKIWGDKYHYSFRLDENLYQYVDCLKKLLYLKLNGEDWAVVLLEYLKTKTKEPQSMSEYRNHRQDIVTPLGWAGTPEFVPKTEESNDRTT